MNIINVDLDLFKLVLDQELRKLTGKTLKRFELSDDKEVIKKQIKEIQYEWGRDLLDALKIGKIIFINASEQKSKGEKNG